MDRGRRADQPFHLVPRGGMPKEALLQRLRDAGVGLGLCPLELAPRLRLLLLDQAEGAAGQPLTRNCAPHGAITVASAPLDDDEDVPRGFYLRRIEGTLWLRGYRSWDGHLWSPGDILAFSKGRED